MKKAVTTILIILIIVAVGLGAYWFFDSQERGGGDILNNISSYFPFGTSPEAPNTEGENGGASGTGTETGTGNTGNNGSAESTPTPQLWQITREPQSGVVIFQNKGDAKTFVRYLDKATGNVFENRLDILEKKRISNTTIPKVYEAKWFAGGNSLVLQYTSDNTDTIKSLYAKLMPPNASSTLGTGVGTEAGVEVGDGLDLQELRGVFLPADAHELSIEPGQVGNERVFYLLPNTANGVSGYVANGDGSKPSLIFNSPLHEWLASWPDKETVTLTTKPSAGIPGFLYFLGSKSGSFKKILGEINGLTTLTKPDASQVLFSEASRSGIAFNVLDVKTGVRKALFKTTLPEKCVWSKTKESTIYCAIPKLVPNNTYPDAWYQGVVSFNDMIWKIDTVSGAAEILMDPKTFAAVEIDATNLTLDQKENYLIFTNKKDYTLWGLKLIEA